MYFAFVMKDNTYICHDKNANAMSDVFECEVSGVPRGLMPPQMYLPRKDSFGFFEFLDFLDA